MYNNGISCSFSSLLHTPSTCGSSVTDPLDVQCVTLEKCNEDVYSHLKFLKVGPDTICDEKTLLLARAGTVLVIGFFNNHVKKLSFWNCLRPLNIVLGKFKVNRSHLAMTICPYHREMFGLRWNSGKVKCFVLMEVAGHKDPKTKGDQGLNSTESLFILSVHWGSFTLLDLVSHAYYRFCGLRFHLLI